MMNSLDEGTKARGSSRNVGRHDETPSFPGARQHRLNGQLFTERGEAKTTIVANNSGKTSYVAFHRETVELHDHMINLDATALTDFVEDQGCCLAGNLLTCDGRVIRFDIDFEGEAYRAWSVWGAILSINEWAEHQISDGRPKQGSPLDVAAKLIRAGRL